MKNEGTNLLILTNVLKQIVSYEKLGIFAPFESVCFGHALFEACWYATFEEKERSNLQPMNIKFAQSLIQAYVTWPKIKKRKGKVDKDLFGCKFVTIEAKHINENKVCIQNGNFLVGI